MKCPNCGERISVGLRTYLGEAFKCAKCAATLRFPKRKGQLFILLWPTYLIVFSLMGWIMAGIDPSFKSGSLADPLVYTYVLTMFVYFLVMGFLGYKVKLQLIQPAPLCSGCGSTVTVENAHFCPRCGAGMSPRAGRQAVRIGQVVSAPRTQEVASSGSVGTCMVCEQEFRLGSDCAYCPHCGSPAHKTHLLEYLHVHSQCPACHGHLDEKELGQHLAREPRQSKGKKIAAETSCVAERDRKRRTPRGE